MNDLFLKSLAVFFQSLGRVYCVDLRVRVFFLTL